jgi:hypothetical protein
MAGSMGFAINNTKAVIEGLLKKKSEFVRTPKYRIVDKKDHWRNKKYVPVRMSLTVYLEAALALYCLFGVGASIYFLELSAVPFQLLFSMGFGLVSVMSIKHAILVRKLKNEAAGTKGPKQPLVRQEVGKPEDLVIVE